MTIEKIKESVAQIAEQYNIKNVKLFGSRAEGTERPDSDIDLIVEFSVPVTLITLASLKYRIEDMLGLNVDIIHGPLRDNDFLEINTEIEIYAA